MPLPAVILVAFLTLLPALPATAAEAPVSEATAQCLECHSVFHPGIVHDWKKSRHASVTPKQAAAAVGLARKISTPTVAEELQATTVGCAECHTMRPQAHADTFDHNGFEVHVVVSPDDCAACHLEERQQYSENIMALARKNLDDNPIYQKLQQAILGTPTLKDGRLGFAAVDDITRADACNYCHGTRLEVTGRVKRDTDAGEMEFPVIKGWPNQGSGRLNPDGSSGACTACHARHQFSMEMARKPYTCMECHAGPDVPAYKVYSISKHGNIFSSAQSGWNFNAVPWAVGRDFTAPTCAVCHMSLLVNADGELINRRSHKISDRLDWRLFGLIYAHPQPKQPDTTVIRNRAGLNLPTDFDGTPANAFLLDAPTRAQHRETMSATCRSCHDASWVAGHFKRLDHVIATSNAGMRTATALMESIWKQGLAKGLNQGADPFDEPIERLWTDGWLFYANHIRYSAAMAGGGDLGVFENGRYHLAKTVANMNEWLTLRSMATAAKHGAKK